MQKWNDIKPEARNKLDKLTASIPEEDLIEKAKKSIKEYMRGDYTKNYDFLVEIPDEEDDYVRISSSRLKRSSKGR